MLKRFKSRNPGIYDKINLENQTSTKLSESFNFCKDSTLSVYKKIK